MLSQVRAVLTQYMYFVLEQLFRVFELVMEGEIRI